MKTRIALSLTIVALALAVGCRNTHLGHDTAGHTYKAAIQAQAEGDDAVEAPELTADDAKRVLHVQRTGEAESASSESTTTLMTPMTLMSTGSSGPAASGLWPGASGPIKLEAK